MMQIGFVMEQALGHITHTRNLQTNVPRDLTVQAHWGLVPFAAEGMAARVPLYKSNWTVRAGLRARAVLRDMTRHTRLDALLFHTQVPAVLNASWIRKIPSVVSIDATPLQYDALGDVYKHQAGPAWLENAKWRLNRNCFREAKHLVAWSEWAKQGLIDGYEVPAEKVSVIPPGVNVGDWRSPIPRTTDKSGPFRILFVGGDFERKGGRVLLDAWRRIVARAKTGDRPVELHLVTSEKLPPEQGMFVHHGLQANSAPLKQLYFDSDIFCLPTMGDCLPMVLSEAGAAGLPTISTGVAAIPEITRDGDTGFIVPPRDVAALEAAIDRLMTNAELRLRMGARAVDVVSGNFEAEHNATRLLDVLKHVATQRRQ
jgi:glycosyltransferase involved in cell wall biosynthesis